MNRIILLNVEDAWIKRGGETAGASGSANAVTLRMRFDQCWDGTSKTAYFTDALGENSVKVLLGLDLLTEDGAYDVPVPGEAMAYPGQATVTVTGQSQGRIITTQAARFKVLDAMVPDSAGNSKPITPDEASQLQAQIDALEDIFVVNRDQAQAAADEAESAKNAVLDALDNLPPGAVLVIDDLTTGGKTVALSAEQGKVLEETKADRQLSNLDTPQAALAALGAGVRQNELDNAYFVGGGSQQGNGQLPINQMGLTKYTAGSLFSQSFDRWTVTNSTIELMPEGVKLIAQSDDSYMTQVVESPKRFIGKTLTASAMIDEVQGMAYVKAYAYDGATYTVAESNRITSKGIASTTITVPANTQELFVRCYVQSGSNARFLAAKLETGENQTLAYQDSDGNWQLLPQPDSSYGAQLLECQHYLIPMQNSEERISRVTTSGVRAWFPTPTPMRTDPVLISGSFQVKTLASGNVMTNAVWAYQVEGCGVMVTATLEAHGQTDGTIYSNNAILSAQL